MVDLSATPDQITALLPFMTAAERAELDTLLAADKELWRPLPGPQSMALNSAADIIGYGGAAGGGKTDLACGAALTRHKRTMILRREATQLTGIIDRLTSILGGRDGYNGQDRIWRLQGRQIEFGSTPNAGDETKYQGRPHDLKVFDEATNFLEAQVRFLMGWVRSEDPSQKCQTILTFNPPTTAEGRWIIPFFGPWLDDKHPNPARPGELRWFATVAGKDMEMESDQPFVLVNDTPIYGFDPSEHTPEEIIRPLSRTFIPSKVTDNVYYVRSGYLSTLQGLPEPLRSQMLRGDFMAGAEDDIWQVIPTAWIDASMAKWRPWVGNKPAMDSMGVDAVRGGRDEMVIAKRHGIWFDQLVTHPGHTVPNGATGMALIMVERRDLAPIHLDVIGIGSSVYDSLVQANQQVIGVDNRHGTNERTADQTLGFYNMRAQTYWRMREALNPDQPNPIILPPDNKLRADLAAPRWSPTPKGIKVELKEDIIDRLKRSPDRGDAAVLALITTLKHHVVRGIFDRRGGSDYDLHKDLNAGYDIHSDLRF